MCHGQTLLSQWRGWFIFGDIGNVWLNRLDKGVFRIIVTTVTCCSFLIASTIDLQVFSSVRKRKDLNIHNNLSMSYVFATYVGEGGTTTKLITEVVLMVWQICQLVSRMNFCEWKGDEKLSLRKSWRSFIIICPNTSFGILDIWIIVRCQISKKIPLIGFVCRF